MSFSPGDVFYVGVEELAENEIVGIALDAAGGQSTWAAFTGRNPVTAGTVATVPTFGSAFAGDFMIRALVVPAAMPEPATFTALAGLIALAAGASRRRMR